jgi:acetyl-CoA carboxylase alpha subunit
MAKVVLEFEKPIYELEQKIEEIKNLSDSVDVSDDIRKEGRTAS